MRDSVYEIEELPSLPPIGGGSVFDSIEYTEPAKRLAATVAELYRETLERRGFVADDAQYAAVMRLQRVYEEWIAYKARRSSALRRSCDRRCRAACICGAASAAARASCSTAFT